MTIWGWLSILIGISGIMSLWIVAMGKTGKRTPIIGDEDAP